MSWVIETTDEFDTWWDSISEAVQIDVDACVQLLEKYGPTLPRPYSDTIKHSKHKNMKELRIQHKGAPYRVLYAFDPHRIAILLIGGHKSGDDRWYKKHIPIADRLFEVHLQKLEESEL
ncbi:MAG: type II toxin-antitoxin system RelE/ParE family toxin [Candidatus Omnitrophota bacterium]|nr:MAG: type II toxin-antitoxin system RelE/ParE family toxin [Candidatus Omnitrophota bacterium]